MYSSRMLCVVGLAVAAMSWLPSASGQKLVSNHLFSISLPSTLLVETNNTNTLVAFGPRGMEAPPFLWVFFCALAPDTKNVARCDSSWQPLSANEVRELVLAPLVWDGAIATRDRGNGVSEWSACAVKPGGGLVTCIRRLRSQVGYVDLRYLSDLPQHDVEQIMERFVASINWR